MFARKVSLDVCCMESDWVCCMGSGWYAGGPLRCVAMYTMIGDLAKDTMALGYLYAPPSSPDYVPLFTPPKRTLVPKGGNAVRILSKADTKVDQATSSTKPTTKDRGLFSPTSLTRRTVTPLTSSLPIQHPKPQITSLTLITSAV